MIGNKSYEEHVKYFTNMFDCFKNADQGHNLLTILEAIECKVIFDQKRKNIIDVCDTPMFKDFETWSNWLCLRNIDSQNENLQDDDDENEDNNEHSQYRNEVQNGI